MSVPPDGGVKTPPFRLDLKTGMASEVDARADLAAARSRKLVEALGSGDATKSATVRLWICAGQIHVGKGHVRDAQIDVVQEINKRNLDPQLGTLGYVEAL